MLKWKNLTVVAGLLLSCASIGASQSFPDKPIQLVVPMAPGGATDLVARIWVKHVTLEAGINITVVNRPGAGSAIGAAEVARSKPDGYTLLMGTTSSQIINPTVTVSKYPYDGLNDFVTVDIVGLSPTCIVVHPSVPANTVKELTSLIKANPGKYSYGSAGTGSLTHLAGEMYKDIAGLDLIHVPYKGGGPSMTDLIAGHIKVATPTLSKTVLSNHKAGKLRIIGINSTSRLKSNSEILTSIEQGLPGMKADLFTAVFAPAGTPDEVVKFLRQTSKKVTASSAFAEELANTGAELLNVADPGGYILQETTRYKSIIKKIGFKISQ